LRGRYFGPNAEKTLRVAAARELALVAAEPLLLGFTTQRAFADKAELAVVLLKTSATAERVARVASLLSQFPAAPRVATSTSDETSVDFRKGGLYMHGVLDFPGRDQVERRGVANHSPAPLAF
jgi:hypothetical protein